MRKIMVWGGEHPDEKMAVACVGSLREFHVPNVDADIANPEALARGKRYVDVNMVTAYPGNPESPVYEERRANEVLQRSAGYYATVSLHNINCFGGNMAAVCPKRGVSPAVLGMVKWLGITDIVAVTYDGMPRYAHNSIMLDTLAHGPGADIARLRAAVNILANAPRPLTAAAGDFNWYDYVEPLDDKTSDPAVVITAGDAVRAFRPLPPQVAACLGMAANDVFSGWRHEPNDDGYWAEVVRPIPVPDDSSWPKD